MQNNGEISTDRHRRRVIGLAVGYVLTTVLLGAALIFFPLYRLIGELHQTRLAGELRGQVQAIDQYLQRVDAVTRQIASRSMIRQWLGEYVAGTLSRAALAELTNPRMTDALKQSSELVGVVRLGPAGEVVAAVGAAIPATAWPAPSRISDEIVFSDPQVIDNRLWLLTAAPLFAPGGQRLGTDILLFSGAPLEQLLVAAGGHADVTALGRSDRGGRQLFLLQQQGRVTHNHHTLPWNWLSHTLAEAAAAPSGIVETAAEEGQPARSVAFAHLPTTNWVLAYGVDRQAFTALARRTLGPVAAGAFLFALLGGAGIGLLLRPLFARMAADTVALARGNDELRREIDERRALAIALQRSEEAWSKTFAAITDAVSILGPDGTILRMNPACQALFDNFPPERRHERMCRLLCGRDAPGHNCPYGRMLAEGVPSSGDIEVADTGRIYQIIVYPLREADGNIHRGVHVVRDITEQQHLERAKDEMISAVSHEMRTPLTAILGFVEYLIENEVPRAEAVEHLRTTHREAERLNDLVNDFLELQRLEAHLVTYRMEELPVEPFLEEVLRSRALAAPRHTLVADYAPGLPTLRGDRRYLRRAVRNLLDNAVKYSPGGGRIELSATAQAEGVLIQVRDQGIGIPATALDIIFQRFYRVDDSDRRVPGGLGLGLALVREVVRAHGGRVWAESILGRGSTFSILLPLAPPPTP